MISEHFSTLSTLADSLCHREEPILREAVFASRSAIAESLPPALFSDVLNHFPIFITHNYVLLLTSDVRNPLSFVDGVGRTVGR